MTLIIDDLRREHRTIAALLDALDRQVGLLAEAGEPDLDALAALAEYFSDFPDQVHHPKEDVIWRALQRRDPDAAARVGDLEGEHFRLKALTRTFVEAIDAMRHDAEVRRDAATHAIRRFIDAERRHMDMEDSVFFPAAERTLTAADWTAIAARADRRPEPIAARADERFDMLRRIVAEAA